MNSRDGREMAAWSDQVKEGVLVIISGDRVKPKEVTELSSLGQTVFFAVERAPGITITDAQFLRAGSPHHE